MRNDLGDDYAFMGCPVTSVRKKQKTFPILITMCVLPIPHMYQYIQQATQRLLLLTSRAPSNRIIYLVNASMMRYQRNRIRCMCFDAFFFFLLPSARPE